jgi:hypothetical protein
MPSPKAPSPDSRHSRHSTGKLAVRIGEAATPVLFAFWVLIVFGPDRIHRVINRTLEIYGERLPVSRCADMQRSLDDAAK